METHPYIAEKENIKPASCGGFVISADGQRLWLLQRDNFPQIPYRGKWGILGGRSEPGESPLDTFIREVREEANVTLDEQQITLLGNLDAGDDRDHCKHIAMAKLTPQQELQIRKGNEGQRIASFSPEELSHLDLVPDLYILFKSPEAIRNLVSGQSPDLDTLGLVHY